MKKAKVMLAAVAVLAIVGGALAFKAKSFELTRYCTTIEEGNFCSSLITSIEPVPQSAAQFTYKYVTTDAGQPCPTNVNDCELGYFANEQ